MIAGTAKPLEDILGMIEPYDKIVLVGCNGCVTVCRVGGEKEVQVLASTIKLARETAGKPIEIKEVTLERQCDPEYVETLRSYIDEDYQAVLSIACGAGVQLIAEQYAKTPVFPGINTSFIGVTVEQGVWAERCRACGDCVLHLTGGICPVTRCSKGIFIGPCGGSVDGHCEVSKDIPCGWQLIIDRLKTLGQLDNYEKLQELKRLRSRQDGGPRCIVREDLKL